MNIVIFLLIGLVAGATASFLIEGRGQGWLGDIFIGIIGASLGGFLFEWCGISTYGIWASIGMSVVGAIVLLVVLDFFFKRGKKTHFPSK